MCHSTFDLQLEGHASSLCTSYENCRAVLVAGRWPFHFNLHSTNVFSFSRTNMKTKNSRCWSELPSKYENSVKAQSCSCCYLDNPGCPSRWLTMTSWLVLKGIPYVCYCTMVTTYASLGDFQIQHSAPGMHKHPAVNSRIHYQTWGVQDFWIINSRQVSYNRG